MQYIKIDRDNKFIYLTGYKNNKKVYEKINFKPYYFLESKEKSDIKGFITNKFLKKYSFNSISDYFKKIDELNKLNILVYGNIDPVYQYISDLNYDNNLNNLIYCFFDIEVYHESHSLSKILNYEGEIVSITLYDNKIKKYIVLTTAGNINIEDKNVILKYCKNQKDILNKFIIYLKKVKPDILTGWNIEGFDLPYILTKMKENNINFNKLSPFNKVEINKYIKIFGINIIDYYHLYKKFLHIHSSVTPDNFKLDTILKLELGEKEGKIDYSEYNNIFEFYKKNIQKFIKYNIQDVRGLVKLNEKKKLLELIVKLSYISGVNFSDVFSSTKVWYTFLYNNLKKKNIIIPEKYKEQQSEDSYAGAFVKEPIQGIKKWIVVYDLNSLYPNIIVQWNIENGTIIDDEKLPKELKEIKKNFNIKYFYKNYNNIKKILKKYNVILSPSGYFFKKDKISEFSNYLKNIYSLRKKTKNLMLEEQKKKNYKLSNELYIYQLALKIMLNSFYGSLGTEYFSFYNVKLAETITKTGQFIIKSLIAKVNNKLSKMLNTKKDFIVYSDTDSIAICLEDFNKENTYEFVDEFSKKYITPIIDKTLNEIYEGFNCIEKRLQMKREKIANKIFNKAKKSYVLSIIEEEGIRYKEPKIKITGLQVIKSSTPILIRKYLLEDINYLIKEENITVEYFKKRYFELKNKIKNIDLNLIAFPRSVNNLEKWCVDIFKKQIKVGTPVHVKGCCLYNSLIEKYNLNLEKINSGDKIFFIYLKENNKYKVNTISWKYEYPKNEIFKNIKNLIDYNKQLENSYLKILTNLLEAININFDVNRKKTF